METGRDRLRPRRGESTKRRPLSLSYRALEFAGGGVPVGKVRFAELLPPLHHIFGGGLTMPLGITLERDVQYYDYEVYSRKASSAFDEDVGDAAKELIAQQRGSYGKLFGVWKEGYEAPPRNPLAGDLKAKSVLNTDFEVCSYRPVGRDCHFMINKTTIKKDIFYNYLFFFDNHFSISDSLNLTLLPIFK
jgi:hypothetical protein